MATPLPEPVKAGDAKATEPSTNEPQFALPVDSEHKAKTIRLLSFAQPHMHSGVLCLLMLSCCVSAGGMPRAHHSLTPHEYSVEIFACFFVCVCVCVCTCIRSLMNSGVAQRQVVRSRGPLLMTQQINPIMNRYGRGTGSFVYFGKCMTLLSV